ncbi:MAG: cobalt ECF transporter T component CbiQ [Thiohalocapsa sp.]|uniref:cobalt ECF transporter T component CbiQ n=1 Tax=Thiohalocapsa sp. TaxID=2497641 RepID=UPI0025F63F40|nr:cobalt ECF transporter T component CbiQ [Thiohalocapsa sp.]MCG6943262.1 cobalt ECF transporter T component CbiQ [Thiohalocapsa sp.]
MQPSPLSPRGGRLLAQHDPRLLVVALVLFALVTVSLKTPTAAAVALAAALALAAAGGLPLRELLRRLAVLEGFMLVVLATLPFTVPGEAWLTFGPLTATREGLFTAVLIALKANAVVLALLGLLGGLEPAVLGHALGRLGLPEKLVHLLLLTVRQIALLDQEQRRLRQAMRARAFVPRSDRHTWISYGNLIGMLLVRSLERSRRIEAAMRCRGFQGRLYLLDSHRWRFPDTAWLVGLLPLLAGLLALDRLS